MIYEDFRFGDLDYGLAGHSGLKECLEHEWREKLSFKLHKCYGLKYILDEATINDLAVYHIDNDRNVSCQILHIDAI
jgi:hypothetical protein